MLGLVITLLCILPIIYNLVGANLFGEYSNSISPELFTGRGIIWTIILSEFNEFFWLGVGYGGYWVGTVREVFDFENSFFTILNSSHNGYLHIITNLGVIGLFIFITITLFKVATFGSRLELWELAFLVFIILHAVFETDFFVYKNVWILFCAVLSKIEYHTDKNVLSNTNV